MMTRTVFDTNCKIKTKLKIDIDFDYKAFLKYMLENYIDHALWIANKLDFEICGIDTMNSTNNNTHIFIYINKELREEERLHIQYALGDDIGRYNLSIERLKQWGQPYDKMFIKKIRPRK